MKKPCKVCQNEPKYQYTDVYLGKRQVFMRCPECGRVGPMGAADPQALRYWNEEQCETSSK